MRQISNNPGSGVRCVLLMRRAAGCADIKRRGEETRTGVMSMSLEYEPLSASRNWYRWQLAAHSGECIFVPGNPAIINASGYVGNAEMAAYGDHHLICINAAAFNGRKRKSALASSK